MQAGAPPWIRWAGVAAVAGGLLAVVLVIPLSIAFGIQYPEERGTTSWVMSLRPTMDFALDFASPRTVYETYGRIIDLAYLLVLPSVVALHRLQRDPERENEQRAFTILVTFLVVTFVGVAGDYWLNGLGYPVEVIGLLGLSIATTRYGLVTRRLAVVPAVYSHLLIVCGPGAAVGLAVTGHIPGGPTVVLLLPWLALGFGFALGRGEGRPVAGPA